MIRGVLRQKERCQVRMPKKAYSEKIMSFAFMPVGSWKHLRNGRELGVITRNARAYDHSQRPGRMKIIINDFHLPVREPVHAAYCIQSESLPVEFLGRMHDLLR